MQTKPHDAEHNFDLILKELNNAFILNHPKEVARQIETMSPKNALKIFESHKISSLHQVWSNIAPGAADSLLVLFSDEMASELLMNMSPNECAALINRFNKIKKAKLLSLLSDSVKQEIEELLEYPDDSVGKLMNKNIIAFNKNSTVAEAIKKLKKKKIKSFHYLFIFDDDMHLYGQVDIQDIVLLASSEVKLASLATEIPVHATILESKHDVLKKMQRLKISTVPVLDANERIVGIIHEGQIIGALNDSISTKMQTMVGVSKDERATSSLWFSVKKRQPWLQINLITAFLASAVVGLFENIISEYTALAVLMPIAAGQSGNTGAQALAVTMRGLILREITTRQWLKLILKEFAAGFINGAAIAFTCGLGVYFWSLNAGLALVISLAMIISMSIASASGALVPLVLKRLGQDPAVSSSIILTTITDIAGFMSFLGIATILSSMLK